MVRIGVRGGGCGGFEYAFHFDENFDEKQDTKYESNGVQVVVDNKSALYLDGLTVDWQETLEKRGFTFDNPNSTRSCGCGNSFSV